MDQTDQMATAIDPTMFAAVSQVADAHGWAGVTAELVAKAAGVNRTTLYRNGYTRERLLTDAATEMAAMFETATLRALASSGTAHDRMLRLLEALYDLADEHLGLLAGLYDGPSALFHLGLTNSDPTLITRMEYTSPFERLLTDGNTDGTLRSDQPHDDAELIFNTAGWTYIHFRRSHAWRPNKARAAITKITLAAFEPSVLP